MNPKNQVWVLVRFCLLIDKLNKQRSKNLKLKLLIKFKLQLEVNNVNEQNRFKLKLKGWLSLSNWMMLFKPFKKFRKEKCIICKVIDEQVFFFLIQILFEYYNFRNYYLYIPLHLCLNCTFVIKIERKNDTKSQSIAHFINKMF